MTSEKPTGVFVRLPLNDDQIQALENRICEYEDALLAIGTPVTGGELEVVAYDNLASGHLSRVKPVGPNINLVRQSDALAKLAEKDAEIARLWSALDDIEMGIDALPDELECGDRMTAREMQRQALIIVKEEMKALKGPEA